MTMKLAKFEFLFFFLVLQDVSRIFVQFFFNGIYLENQKINQDERTQLN